VFNETAQRTRQRIACVDKMMEGFGMTPLRRRSMRWQVAGSRAAICSSANCEGSGSVRAQRYEAARNQELSPRPCAARAPVLHFRRPGGWPGDAIARARITMFPACRIAIRAP
jgi:hypothetical protein